MISTSNRLRQLESLRTVTSLSFPSNDIHRLINQFSSFSVVSFGPIVSCSRCTKAHVVRFEQCPHQRCLDHIHDTRLKVHQTCSRHKSHRSCLLVVHIDLVQSLLVVALFWLSLELTVGFELVLCTHCAPECISNLVTALPNLDVDNFSHHSDRMFVVTR